MTTVPEKWRVEKCCAGACCVCGLWRTRRGCIRGKGCLREGLKVLCGEVVLHGEG